MEQVERQGVVPTWGTVSLRQHSARPNPALELTRYGRRPWLGGIRCAHCVPPSQGCLPQRSAQLYVSLLTDADQARVVCVNTKHQLQQVGALSRQQRLPAFGGRHFAQRPGQSAATWNTRTQWLASHVLRPASDGRVTSAAFPPVRRQSSSSRLFLRRLAALWSAPTQCLAVQVLRPASDGRIAGAAVLLAQRRSIRGANLLPSRACRRPPRRAKPQRCRGNQQLPSNSLRLCGRSNPTIQSWSFRVQRLPVNRSRSRRQIVHWHMSLQLASGSLNDAVMLGRVRGYCGMFQSTCVNAQANPSTRTSR